MRWIAAEAKGSARGLAAWLAAATLLGFLVSFSSVAVGSLPRDGFVLVHLAVTGAFLVSYARWSGLRGDAAWHNWRLGLLVGALAAIFSVAYVVAQPASPGPQGIDRALALLWLGLVYGTLDALFLTVLPVHAAWSIGWWLGWSDTWRGIGATALLGLLASLLVTAAYHLGFPEFQGREVIRPIIGNAVFTLAYLASASPLAPLLAHIALHLAAVLHAYGTSIPLPPHG